MEKNRVNINGYGLNIKSNGAVALYEDIKSVVR